MKKLIYSFIFTFLLLSASFLILPSPASADQRLAECDLCGYCQNKTPPSTWAKCKACLYPYIKSNNAVDNQTLVIAEDLTNPETFNKQPQPQKGHYYTQLGCISTNLSDFTQPGAAGATVNFLLNRVIFVTVGGIAFFYLLYGAFLIATSQDEPEKLNQGKKTVSGAIIGLIFTLLSVFLVNFIAGSILKIPGFGQ